MTLVSPTCHSVSRGAPSRAITRTFDQHLRPHGIRSTQFSLLSVLEVKGAQSIGQLAEFLGADRTTLTRNLALLEKQSLIKIQPGDDARARIVSVTSKGRGTVSRCFPAWRQAQAAVAAAIGTDMVHNLRKLARASSS